MKKLLLVILVLTVAAACKRTTFPPANLEKPKNSPEYTHEPDVNVPPNSTPPSIQGS